MIHLIGAEILLTRRAPLRTPTRPLTNRTMIAIDTGVFRWAAVWPSGTSGLISGVVGRPALPTGVENTPPPESLLPAVLADRLGRRSTPTPGRPTVALSNRTFRCRRLMNYPASALHVAISVVEPRVVLVMAA